MSAWTDYRENEIVRGLYRSHGMIAWPASTAVTVGQRIWSTNSYGPYAYECIVAGTTGSTQPTWPTTLGGTVTDGTATWMCIYFGVPKRPIYIGLILATRGYWAASTAYSVGDYVLPTAPNGHMYKCTTAGTSGSTQPTWPTTNNGTVTDGTVVWTECYSVLEAGTFAEVSGGGYARVNLNPSDTNWANTNGTNAQTSDSVAITYPAATANWGLVFGSFEADQSSGGNIMEYTVITTPQQINSGATASFAAGALTVTVDN